MLSSIHKNGSEFCECFLLLSFACSVFAVFCCSLVLCALPIHFPSLPSLSEFRSERFFPPLFSNFQILLMSFMGFCHSKASTWKLFFLGNISHGWLRLRSGLRRETWRQARKLCHCSWSIEFWIVFGSRAIWRPLVVPPRLIFPAASSTDFRVHFTIEPADKKPLRNDVTGELTMSFQPFHEPLPWARAFRRYQSPPHSPESVVAGLPVN